MNPEAYDRSYVQNRAQERRDARSEGRAEVREDLAGHLTELRAGSQNQRYRDALDDVAMRMGLATDVVTTVTYKA